MGFFFAQEMEEDGTCPLRGAFPVSGHGQTWGQGLNEEKIQEHEIVHGVHAR
jgi:hypothetical protein